MEATVLSVGKSVVSGALGYAKSAAAEEVALQLGIQRDQAFIKDELEMMQAFLMAAHDERDENKVIKTWVKQVRDVAYDVEDCLQDFAVRLAKPSWWHLPRTLLDRRRVAKQMKDLRAKVEDVSQRNVRYSLIKGSGSKPSAAAGHSSIPDATKFGIEEARRQQEEAKVDLVQLIKLEGKNLKVIAVWGTSGVLGQTSVIKEAYENTEIKERFESRAWARVMHPFDPKEFLVSILRQFGTTTMLDALVSMSHDDLAHVFIRHVNLKSFLIVINDLSSIEDWDWIKTYFPNNKNGNRIIVSTEQGEIAKLCIGQERPLVSELKQLSTYQSIFAFCEEDSQDGQDLVKSGSCSNAIITGTNSSTMSTTSEIHEDQPENIDGKNVVDALEESHLIGRKKEKADIIKLISNQASQQFHVISIWGMGGLGKTTLVKDVYQSHELDDTFEKRACVTIMRPFILEELLRSLFMQLNDQPYGGKETKKLQELDDKLAVLLEKKRILIVLDNLSYITEWDLIIQHFPPIKKARKIIITTRERDIAEHCSEIQENIYELKTLTYNDAFNLFSKKVFKDIANPGKQYPELAEEAKPILKKCGGLPLAIVTVGGFLANQPKTIVEWRKLNEHISAELEMNPELEPIRSVLLKSYDGLPYHLKSCFLYLSIFPEDFNISRGRLVRRWTAEGYPREVRGKPFEEIADSYFMELIARSMILPVRSGMFRKGIDSCQLHDLMREISISKSRDENLVYRLEEGCSLNTQGTVRHLSISRSWEGDESEYESTVDMSRIRSLTVFGKWRPFFISEKMRLLRVLDLENAPGLLDHHLEHIGELIHLNYFSLRGRSDICRLPNSLGNLRQLQTLDIRGTRIIKLPKSIVKLRKLNYLRAGYPVESDDVVYEEIAKQLPKLARNRPCLLTIMQIWFCVMCLVPQLWENLVEDDGDDLKRRDVCTMFCCIIFPLIAMRLDPCGVAVPRGVRKLKALHTLGVVNISRAKASLQEIQRLTRLRKLLVTGVTEKTSKELCSAIAGLSRLESLSLRSEREPGLHGCLDGMSTSPPGNLRSLKLYGNLVRLPEWIQGLSNLEKLTLQSSRLMDAGATMQVLGCLSNLAILRLLERSFQSEELRFQFRRDEFPSLMVLQLNHVGHLKSLEFEQGAAPKLVILQFSAMPSDTNAGLFSGLKLLQGLNEFTLESGANYKFVEDLRAQLADNPNRPVLKWL